MADHYTRVAAAGTATASEHGFESRRTAPKAAASQQQHHHHHHRRISSVSTVEVIKLTGFSPRAKATHQEPANESSVFDPDWAGFLRVYSSDEEVASPVDGDDLSSASSLLGGSKRASLESQGNADEEDGFVEYDDDCDDDDEEAEQEDDDDDDNVEICDAVLSSPGKQTGIFDYAKQVQVCRAEAVRFFRPGRAKIVRLSKAPGYPVTFKRPASPADLPLTPPEAADVNEDEIGVEQTRPRKVPGPAETVPPGRRPSNLPKLKIRPGSSPWTPDPSPPAEPQSAAAPPPTPPLTPGRRQKLPVSLSFLARSSRGKATNGRDPNERPAPRYRIVVPPPTPPTLPPMSDKRTPRGANERAPTLVLPPSPYDDEDETDSDRSEMHPNYPATGPHGRKYSLGVATLARKPVPGQTQRDRNPMAAKRLSLQA